MATEELSYEILDGPSRLELGLCLLEPCPEDYVEQRVVGFLLRNHSTREEGDWFFGHVTRWALVNEDTLSIGGVMDDDGSSFQSLTYNVRLRQGFMQIDPDGAVKSKALDEEILARLSGKDREIALNARAGIRRR